MSAWPRSATFLPLALVLAGCASSPGPASGPVRTPESSPTSSVDPSPAGGLPATELTGESRIFEIPHQAGSVAVSGGAVWVIPHMEPVLVRIDPASGTTRSFELPGVGGELDATEDELWMSLSEPDSFEPLALARVDPTTGAVTARIDEPLGFPAVVGDHVFAADQRSVHVFDKSTGAPVDVKTGNIGALSGWAAVTDGVWVVGSKRAVRIDGKTLDTEDVTNRLRGDVPLAFAGGRYWARTPGGGLASYASDLSDRREYDMPGTVFPDAAVVDEDLYVAVKVPFGFDSSMLVRIDTALDEPVSAVTTPGGQGLEYGIDSDGSCLWIPVVRTPEVYRACPAP